MENLWTFSAGTILPYDSISCASANHLIYPPGSKAESILCFQKQGPDLVINQPKECLDKMGEWCQEHHAASGEPLYLYQHHSVF